MVLSVLMMEVMMDGWVFTYDFLGDLGGWLRKVGVVRDG